MDWLPAYLKLDVGWIVITLVEVKLFACILYSYKSEQTY